MKIDIYYNDKYQVVDLDTFGKDVVSFGRGADCDIVINQNFVSRLHGCFYKENGNWFIQDMNSTNGIHKNYIQNGKESKKIQSSILDGNIFEIRRNAANDSVKFKRHADETSVLGTPGFDQQSAFGRPGTGSLSQNQMNQGTGTGTLPSYGNGSGAMPSYGNGSGAMASYGNGSGAMPSYGNGSGATPSYGNGAGFNPSNNVNPPKKNPKKFKILIPILISIAAVLLIGVGIGVYVYYNVDTTFDTKYRKGIKKIRCYRYSEKNPEDTLYEVVSGTYTKKLGDLSDLLNPTFYTKDVVVIYFDDKISTKNKKKIMKKYGEGILAQCDTLNQVQLYVGEGKKLDALESMCEDIEKEDGVLFATVDNLEACGFDSTYGSTNDPWAGTDEDAYWHMKAIHADEAWSKKNDIEEVKVGEYDCGMYGDHEDLKNIVTYIRDEDKTNANEDYDESYAHATHVAGIIAAEHDNDKGVAGVANNAKIDFVFAYGDKVEIDLKLIKVGVNYISEVGQFYHLMQLIKDDCKVINISMGYNYDYENYPEHKDEIDRDSYYSSFFISRMLDKGYDFIICQAAGNADVDARNSGMFAGIEEDNAFKGGQSYDEIIGRVIIVGAMGYMDSSDDLELAYFSNYGDRVSVCAPGEKIYSTLHPSDYSEEYYDYMDGTSMATPIVTGVCAMTWGANPKLKGSEVKDFVCNKTDTTVAGYEVSDTEIYNLVNEEKAVQAALDSK